MLTALTVGVYSARAQATTAIQAGCVPPVSGLIGWWPGDGDSNNLAGANNVILKNVAFAPGQVDQAFKLDQTNSYIQIPGQFKTITSAFTIEAWVWNAASPADGLRYLAAAPASPALSGSGDTQERIVLSFDTRSSNKGFIYTLRTQDGTVSTLTTDVKVAAGQWYHLAATYDGKRQELFVNGSSVASTSLNLPFGYAPDQDLFIGFPGGPGSETRIDEVAMFDRALTGSEVEAQAVAGVSGMCKGPAIIGIGAAGVGNVQLSLRGQTGKKLTIQASTNLKNWDPISTVPNFSGVDRAFDPAAGGFPMRFYRVMSE